MRLRQALAFTTAGALASLFVTFFSTTTSFLNPRYGADSAIFRVVGTALSNGLDLYVDVWDHKGPGLFLIQWLAQEIWPGRAGIFLLQVLSLTVSLWLLGKFAGRLLSPVMVLASQLLFLAVLAPTYEGGNLTEEWSLPFTMFVLWALTKPWTDEAEVVSRTILFASGAALAFVFFIRLNNAAAIIAVFVAYFLYVLITRADFWKQFLISVAGFFTVCLAFVLFFLAAGSLSEMIHATFTFNFSYIGNSNVSTLKSLENGYFLLAVGFAALSLLGGLVDFQLKKRPWYLVLAISMVLVGLLATITSATSYYHYLQLLIPGAVVGIVLIFQIFTDRIRVIAATLVIVLSMLPIVKFAKYTALSSQNSSEQEFTNQIEDILDHVPPKEWDSIFAWELTAQYFLVTKTQPLHRFFTFQGWWGQSDPRITVELKNFLSDSPPEWLLTPLGGMGNDEIGLIVDQRYAEVARNEKLILSRLK